MSDRIAVMSDGVIEQVGDGKAVYDRPESTFVASFVGENNPFAGKVSRSAKDGVVVDTPLGPLRGGNPKGLKAGDRAILFVRPELFKLGKGAKDSTLSSVVKSVAFEGNITHLFLEGAGKKDITLAIARHGSADIPGQGETATINYDPSYAVALPEGKMARE
jgi:spermidine/putrescine transport system ATP-binding protein